MPNELESRNFSAGGGVREVAAVGTVGGFASLFSVAACCVLPLALASVGVGVGGLAFLVPLHWPLTAISALAIGTGWFLYLRKRRACARDNACSTTGPSTATLVMLSFASAFVLPSAVWKLWFERPMMNWLTG